MTSLRVRQWLALAPALFLGAWLAAAPAHGAGTEEAAPPENLDYRAGLEAIQMSDWKRAISN